MRGAENADLLLDCNPPRQWRCGASRSRKTTLHLTALRAAIHARGPAAEADAVERDVVVSLGPNAAGGGPGVILLVLLKDRHPHDRIDVEWCGAPSGEEICPPLRPVAGRKREDHPVADAARYRGASKVDDASGIAVVADPL